MQLNEMNFLSLNQNIHIFAHITMGAGFDRITEMISGVWVHFISYRILYLDVCNNISSMGLHSQTSIWENKQIIANSKGVEQYN